MLRRWSGGRRSSTLPHSRCSSLTHTLSPSRWLLRRERNREHAKKSRIRKRLLLDTLSDQLEGLRAENVKLRCALLPAALLSLPF